MLFFGKKTPFDSEEDNTVSLKGLSPVRVPVDDGNGGLKLVRFAFDLLLHLHQRPSKSSSSSSFFASFATRTEKKNQIKINRDSAPRDPAPPRSKNAKREFPRAAFRALPVAAPCLPRGRVLSSFQRRRKEVAKVPSKQSKTSSSPGATNKTTNSNPRKKSTSANSGKNASAATARSASSSRRKRAANMQSRSAPSPSTRLQGSSFSVAEGRTTREGCRTSQTRSLRVRRGAGSGEMGKRMELLKVEIKNTTEKLLTTEMFRVSLSLSLSSSNLLTRRHAHSDNFKFVLQRRTR